MPYGVFGLATPRKASLGAGWVSIREEGGSDGGSPAMGLTAYFS